MKEMQNILQNYILNHDKQRRYVSVLTALSILVSFIVPFSLMENAESKSGQLVCSAYEHTHSQDCWLLECSEEHEHTDECVSLICTLTEHTHDNECYSAPTEAESVEIVETTEASTEVTAENDITETTPSDEIIDEISEDNSEEISEETEMIGDIIEETEEIIEVIPEGEIEIIPEDEIEVMPEPDIDEIIERNKLFAAFEVFNTMKREPANIELDADSWFKADPGSILGVATHFHVFADTVSLQSHVHGNIATNNLLNCGAFGVYNNKLNGMDSTNYIRNIGEYVGLDNAFQTQLVLGSDFTYYQWFNHYIIRNKHTGASYTIPFDKFGGSMWKYFPRIIIDKPNKPYINILKELENFETLSENIAHREVTTNVGISGKDDPNKPLTIDCNNVTDKYVYQYINATDDMNMWGGNSMKEIRVTGLSEDQFLFVTIDLTGHDNAYFNKSWLVEEPNSSGDTFGTGESPLSEGGCRVIYNFVKNDGSGNYVPFDGKLVLGERRNGAILAPAADVNGAGNTNGTFICKNFVATGETHRLDIMQEGEEDTFTDWPLFEEPVETISVSVSKIWDDGSIQTNHSEDTVTVQLYKGTNFDTSTPIGNPVTIKGGDSHTWSGLIKLSSEQKYFVKEIEYSVENGAIYTATYDNNGNNGGNIQITNTRQDLSLTVKKEWVGEPNTLVEVKLYQSAKSDLSDKKEHGNITLSSSNNWTHTWENLPSGYYYSVEETALDDYTISYSSNNGTNQGNQTIIITNVKNKADIPKIDISVEKTWSDIGHSNDSVEVELYQANRADAPESEWTKVSGFEKITLNQNNSWKYTFKDVPKYEGVYYFVKEVGCNTANGISYTATYDRNGANDTNSNTPIKITNAPQKMNVKVNKIWSDGESEHTNDKVVVNLYKSSEPNKTDFTNVVAIRSATLDITNKWSFNWENLDKGENIYYYVKEVEAVINNKNYCYEVSYSDNGKNNSAEINITNTQRMSVTVNKVWSDENADSKNEITVELYKSFNMGLDVNAGDFSSKEENKVTKVKELDLDKDNKWTAVFENLPIKDIDTADNNKEKLVKITEHEQE